MNENTKRIVGTLMIFGAVILIVLGGLALYLMRGQTQVVATRLEPIVFADLDDGIYEGSYDGYRWASTLQVHVENGEIVKIVIVKDHTLRLQEVAYHLFENVKAAEKLNEVDVVAGSTVSSVAYLRAIEDALKAEPNE